MVTLSNFVIYCQICAPPQKKEKIPIYDDVIFAQPLIAKENNAWLYSSIQSFLIKPKAFKVLIIAIKNTLNLFRNVLICVLMKQKTGYKSSLHPPWHRTFIHSIIHTIIKTYPVCTFIHSYFLTFKHSKVFTFKHSYMHAFIQ